MKYFKMIGFAAVVTAFVGAGIASATKLYSNDAPLSKGTTINAVLKAGTEAVVKTGFFNMACGESTAHGVTSTTGGASEAVKGNISTLNFGECTGDTVITLSNGSLEVHHIAGTTNGTLTGSGTEATMIFHNVGGAHCIYKTEATDLGILTGNTSGRATIHVEAALTRVPTSFLCASSAILTATYEVTTPSPFWVEE
jgi:hypothetical protein